MRKPIYNKVAKTLTLLAIAFSLVMPAFAASGGESPSRIIKVGAFEKNGFVSLDESGKNVGYGAEFMEFISEYANIEFEYVTLTCEQCLSGLLDGTIDIAADTRRTADRENIYSYSKQSIGQIQAAIFVPSTMEDIYYNDYGRLGSLRIGFQSHALNRPLYEQYAEKNGFIAETVEYPSTAALYKAMENGEIDAFGGNANLYSDNLKVVSIYDTEPNYFMAKKDSEALEYLDAAIERLYLTNPEIIISHYKNLTKQQVYGSILLTREEAEYIKANPVLHVSVFSDRRPASWYDESSGSFQGIAIELMDQLAEITGLTFEYVPAKDIKTAMDMLSYSDIDLSMPTVSDTYYSGAVPIKVSKPLYSLSVAMAVKDSRKSLDQPGFTVAVAKSNDGVKDMLSANFGNIGFKRYDSQQDCLDALNDGEVDAYANAMYELEYRLKSPKNQNLRIIYSYSCPIDYCIAMRQDAPDELLSILNSGIALLPQDESERIIRYYSTFLQYEPSLSDRLYEYRSVIIAGSLLLVLLITGWLWYLRLQRRAFAAIQEKSEEATRAAAEATRADKSKSEFLSRMSHDMRTPMNAILGLAELSKEMDMSAETRDLINKIDSSGQFLLGLINDTLDMSKIESGKLELNLQSVDSSEVLEETISLVRAYAKERNVTCSVRQKNVEHCMVKMDRIRVQQVILNIMSNAVKFSHENGTVELYIECYDRRDGVSYDKFVITDHGIGMSREFLPKIFEPFEQERDLTTTQSGGTGLGMAISKRLIDMMGGKIEVESTPGAGTTVTVYLSFERCAQAPAESCMASTQSCIPTGCRVLLCEDNELNTFVAEGLLKNAGCLVECAENGKTGVSMFRASAPGYYQAILMDIRMPVMDGIEAAKAIRALRRSDAGTVPIIAVTANAFEDDIEVCMRAGMNGHIAKPIVPETLLKALLDCLNSKPLEA